MRLLPLWAHRSARLRSALNILIYGESFEVYEGFGGGLVLADSLADWVFAAVDVLGLLVENAAVVVAAEEVAAGDATDFLVLERVAVGAGAHVRREACLSQSEHVRYASLVLLALRIQ